MYTYAIPEKMTLCKGMRVLVPFGPRRVEGYVLGLSEETDVPEQRIRAVIRPLEDDPALLPELIELAEWIQTQYRCLPVEALRLLLPAQMRGQRVKEKTCQMASLAVAPEAAAEALRNLGRAPRQAEALAALVDGARPVSELPRDAVKALEAKGLVRIEDCEVLRAPRVDAAEIPVDPPLMPAQSTVVEELVHALHAQTGRFLLQGVTGSGKTEVYIRLVRAALDLGRGAIVLVPEIALTPQMTGWFHLRFGQSAAVLHSRLSAGERYDEWRRIRRGEARVVVGARSAVFAPVEKLGVIIVDEEHEQSYLSDHHPRYDAREVAAARCENEGAILLLASATPSLSDFARALRGELTLLEMPERVFNRPLPRVRLVDMRQEIARGNYGVLSRALLRGMERCLQAGLQAMLLINRRGYSTFVSCRACGYVVRCERCDVSMTYHQNETALRCHYCGAEQAPPATCPSCGSRYIRYFGAGTQKVEAAVREHFPQARLLRMDHDTTQEKDAHAVLLKRFRDGEADILIGTQMIAKGLDFPRVALVGVIAADAMLNLPDYRSAERTFQLVTQVAGRAGRADTPGYVVVQTYDPEHYSIQAAAAQDFRAFFESEYQRRRKGLYPPFTRMVRLLFEGERPEAVAAACQERHAEMEQYFEENRPLARQVVHMNAREAPLKYIRGLTRWQLFLKLYARGPTPQVLEQLRKLADIPVEGVSVCLQVDPASMI